MGMYKNINLDNNFVCILVAFLVKSFMYNMSLQLNDANMFVLFVCAGGLALQINLLSLSLSMKPRMLFLMQGMLTKDFSHFRRLVTISVPVIVSRLKYVHIKKARVINNHDNIFWRSNIYQCYVSLNFVIIRKQTKLQLKSTNLPYNPSIWNHIVLPVCSNGFNINIVT